MTPLEKVVQAVEGRNPEEMWVGERIARKCVHSQAPARGKLCLTGIGKETQQFACDLVKTVFQDETDEGMLTTIQLDFAKVPRGMPDTAEIRLKRFLKAEFRRMGHDVHQNYLALADWEKWDFYYHLEAWMMNRRPNSLVVLLQNYDALFDGIAEEDAKAMQVVFSGMRPFLKVLEMYEGRLRFFVMTGVRVRRCCGMAGEPEFASESVFDASKPVTFFTHGIKEALRFG